MPSEYSASTPCIRFPSLADGNRHCSRPSMSSKFCSFWSLRWFLSPAWGQGSFLIPCTGQVLYRKLEGEPLETSGILWAALFSLVLCPENCSGLASSKSQCQCRESGRLGSPLCVLWSGYSLQAGDALPYRFPMSWESLSFVVWYLMSWTLSLLYTLGPTYSCLKWEGKSSLRYSILAESRNS